MIIEKPFFYIRHGQTDYNVVGRYQGSKDIPLNATGIQQAYAAKEILRPHKFERIYCSPLSRAWKTAEILNEDKTLPMSQVPDLREMSFGDLEGTLPNGKNLRQEWRNGQFIPPNGESYADFSTRAVAALNFVLKQDDIPLIVAHGGIFWPVATAMGLDDMENLPNAHPIYVRPTNSGWAIDIL